MSVTLCDGKQVAGVRVTRCGFIVIIGAHMSPYSYCELHLILKITLSDIATTKTARLDFMADLVLFKGVVLIVQDDFVMPLKLCMDAGLYILHSVTFLHAHSLQKHINDVCS